MIYRMKPIRVEARNFTESNGAELAAWCGGEFFPDPARAGTWGDFINIRGGSEGIIRADPGDWIVKEPFPIENERDFYPVKAKVFEATFEPVSVS